MADATLRELERAAHASATAAGWSRLADALARVGRDLEACEATVRALVLDPADRARRLLRPEPRTLRPGWSVPWRGLAHPGATRAIPGLRGTFPRVVDLGEGHIAFDAGYPDWHVVAVDLFTGAEVWRHANTTGDPYALAGVAREHLVLLARGQSEVRVIRLHRRTGALEGAHDVPVAPDLDRWAPGAWDFALHRAAGQDVLVTAPTMWQDEAPRRLRLERERVVVEPATFHDRFAPVEGGAVLQAGDDVVGLDNDQRERWRVPGVHLVDVSRTALVREGVEFHLLDPSNGRVVCSRRATELAGHWFGGAASGACFVLGRQEGPEAGTSVSTLTLAALDRTTLEVRWRGRFAGYCGIASTADLTFVITHPRRPDGRGRVRALDAATGDERWGLELPPDIQPSNPLLAGGHLVLRGQGRTPLMVLGPAP